MNLRNAAVSAGVFLLVFSPLVSAGDERPVTFEDILSLKTVGAPRISPDGQSVVQLAAHNTTAMVVIRNQSEAGRIYVDKGQIVHCEAGAVRKAKALHRVLAQQKGRYEILEFPADASVPTTIAGQTELIVLEAMQQIEALERLTAQLPPMVYEITLDEDCSKAINTLSPDEIETYQYLVRYQTIVKVMEESPFTDFTVLRLIHGLLARGFFRTSRASGGVLEETSFSRPEAS